MSFLIEWSVQAVNHERRKALAEKFNLIKYDCDSIEEFQTAYAAWRTRYASIQAIMRLGWHKVGKFANLQPFTTDTVAHFPPSLKIICCSGNGCDAAGTVALAKCGIWYCNTPNACTEAVANAALYLVLDTLRYLALARYSARYAWNLRREWGMEATDPQGKILGIVGLGDIGTSMARKCEAGRRRKHDVEYSLAHGVQSHTSVHELIPSIDWIVLAAPYTSETHHMLGKEQLRLVKPSALRVVYIDRGGMIDEEALIEALELKQVVSVGLDVHEDEPIVNDKLRSNHKVTLLPHMGVCSQTGWTNFERQF